MSESTVAVENTLQAALDPVQVPPGYFPLEVNQFWRGEYRLGSPLPLHWSLVIRTSAAHGSCHEIVGDKDTYSTQDREVQLRSLSNDTNWRGSHVVGYVSPDRMNDLLNHIALVPVVRHDWGWNCQNWVFDVLEGLLKRDDDMYADPKLTLAKLQVQMMYLLEAWENGDI